MNSPLQGWRPNPLGAGRSSESKAGGAQVGEEEEDPHGCSLVAARLVKGDIGAVWESDLTARAKNAESALNKSEISAGRNASAKEHHSQNEIEKQSGSVSYGRGASHGTRQSGKSVRFRVNQGWV